MGSNVEALILDMDGLMLDTEPLYKIAWQRAAADLGFDLTDDWYMTLIGLREEESEEELVAHFGAAFPLQPFREQWPQLFYAQARADGVPTKDGLSELLAFAGSQHIPCAVATSSHRSYTDASLRLAGLDRRFPVVVTGDEIARAKPAPDIYLEAARRLGVEPSRSVALEDSDRGVLAASAAGMIPVLVPDLKPPSPEAVAAAYRVVPTLHDARAVLADLLATRD